MKPSNFEKIYFPPGFVLKNFQAEKSVWVVSTPKLNSLDIKERDIFWNINSWTYFLLTDVSCSLNDSYYRLKAVDIKAPDETLKDYELVHLSPRDMNIHQEIVGDVRLERRSDGERVSYPFRWTQGLGMTLLAPTDELLESGHDLADARAIDNNGAVYGAWLEMPDFLSLAAIATPLGGDEFEHSFLPFLLPPDPFPLAFVYRSGFLNVSAGGRYATAFVDSLQSPGGGIIYDQQTESFQSFQTPASIINPVRYLGVNDLGEAVGYSEIDTLAKAEYLNFSGERRLLQEEFFPGEDDILLSVAHRINRKRIATLSLSRSDGSNEIWALQLSTGSKKLLASSNLSITPPYMNESGNITFAEITNFGQTAPIIHSPEIGHRNLNDITESPIQEYELINPIEITDADEILIQIDGGNPDTTYGILERCISAGLQTTNSLN